MIGENADCFHIFDDDWEDRQLHPLSVVSAISTPFVAAIEAGDLTYDLWNALEAIGNVCNVPTNYSNCALAVDAVAARVAGILPRIYLSESGFLASLNASFKPPRGGVSSSQWCFGFGPNCFVKFEHQSGSLTNIWFNVSSSDNSQLIALQQAMAALDELESSIISDAPLQMAGVISQQYFFANYFHHLAQQSGESRRERGSLRRYE